MKIAVKTRESKRENDYDWNDYFPSNSDVITEATRFVRALEGSDVDRRFAAFVRSQTDAAPAVVISVSTRRRDDVGGAGRGRPIRTMAFLRAEKRDETDLLAAFFAECLRKSDAETIYNAKSDVAKAVESLYQTKKLDGFMQFCRSLSTVNGGGVKLADRWAIPRDKTAPRSALVESLPALIVDNKPFLLALTDRLPTDVLGSLGSMFDNAVVRIFSKAITTDEKLPEPASQKLRRAAAIGGAVLLVLFAAAIGTCSRGGRKGEAKPPTDETGGGTGMSTNRKDFVEMVELAPTNSPAQEATVTNAPSDETGGGTGMSTNRKDFGEMPAPATTNSPTQETTVTNAPSTSQDGSGGSVTPATTNAPLQEAAVTNALPSSQKGLGGPVTSAFTNTLQQKEAVTNSLTTVSDRTRKRKTENE